VMLMHAFNAGLTVINAILIATLVAEYGIRLVPDRRILTTALRYWELPLIGVAYGLGLWGDKLVMWIGGPAASAATAAGALRTMPDYDTPMFFAQLTAIPVLAVFFIHVETNFFLLCQGFYGRITQHASRRELEEAMSRLSRFVFTSVLGLFVGLAAIATLAILGSYAAIDALGLRVAQIGVLRAGLVGMVCHTTAMFCFIFLLYFDLRRPALAVAVTFMLANATFTAVLLPFGFAFYGYGNLLAAGVTLIVAMLLLLRELPWLHYHAFITNNHSLREPPRA
jgi:polysaccharide biosynthesis protein PelG